MKLTSTLKLKLIYVFRINDAAHSGCLKIGEATSDNENIWGLEPNSKALNKAAKKRIDQYTQTAGIAYDLLYTELTIFNDKNGLKAFSDHEVHSVLTRSGVKKKIFDSKNKANEWFITDLETVKKAITAVKEGKDSLHASEVSETQNPILFRPEQKEAIEKTIKQFKKSNEMLWFAKMRFGKTLSALQVVKDHDFTRTLILTHRPVVDKGWFEDFGKIFYDAPQYSYGSKNQGNQFTTLEKDCKKGNSKYIYFASMQDLRGSELVGGNFNKNDEIFGTTWDFVIVDEAHEGTQTELGTNVLRELKKENTKVLHLSGTPFNLLDNYQEEEIYTWDYVMEQKAKADWDNIHFGDPNPYASLPKLNIFTYDLGKLLHGYIDEEVAFNFREFFRVNETGNFLHEKDVFSFLNLICKSDAESNYPYSTEAYRDNFRHSLWMVPGVKEAKALSAMLKTHPVFGQFDIVNVAGDGDEEEANEEALKKVEKAIGDNPHETYTITLSCGRLTTGVSVKAWTAVFMLSGSHNTSASAYMQTIFRVQTPATINGKVKEECFVFDFAPDRTLKVIAETAKVSAKAGKTTGEDRKIMGEFLNFCPIIAFDGSRMRDYDVNGMLEQLKKVYIERVVNNGFEDQHLYNRDQLMQLDDVEVEEFNGLKKVIGSTKAMPKSKDIEINKQGFTEEDYEQIEQAQKKKKKELSPVENELLERYKEQKKMRDTAVSILRGISIRMPLLIYGADVKNEETEISIDNFTDLVDNQSWEEFMPKGVDKATFKKFKKYYEPDVFRAAGKRIRALARATDHVTIEERIERITHIFGTFRNPDKETVLTPWRVVNMHLGDCLGGYVFLDENREKTISQPKYVTQGEVTEEVFATDARILEINSKSGLYPLYVAYSIFRNRIKEQYPTAAPNTLTVEQQQELWDKTVAENVFVLCKTPMAKSITKRTLVGFRAANVNTHYFEDMVRQITQRPEKFIAKIKKGQTYWKANNNNDMKFNAIVGNPPYQDSSENTSDMPIYNHFYDISFRISDKVSFITPGRFLFNAGKTPKDWNKKILSDKHFKVIWYESDSTKVFPNVDIKGGVAVTFRDAKNDFGVIGDFSPHDEVLDILEKVKKNNFKSLSQIVFAPESYRLSKKLHAKNKDVKDRLSKGHTYDLTTNIFEKLNDFFFENRPNDSSSYIQILGRINNERVYYWIKKEYVDKHDNLEKYKVILPKSNGTGSLGEKLSTPLTAEPNIGHNQTFISLGSFETEVEAENLLKYIKSKFLRLLLGTLKVTQDNKKAVWKNIPLQDFTPNSDIDWTKSIPEIDQQLYKKYQLSAEEVVFIERMIKPMG
ncbi:Eco57I restriction-modification methylase domain-containing protein [Arenibacter sp. GZD96]|uniref:Eco57I restriction-modification methylase domain-containing protein n=1 Tax=Aurantibrevibacter litoralis TaxID=3106030 RepID=UPI002AFF4120|nr:Eco57I restriction-modification methylase domain-containing protein [Arenibacter sp. GZD-96]MEA1786660.1 Eco57I restriction-modification methylase domain-containing protein [Arenibacter sp. GZD-96]